MFDDETARACAGAMVRAGYTHSTCLVMVHTGPVPARADAQEGGLDALRGPLTTRWRGILPDVDDEVASWADLYLDPAAGTAWYERRGFRVIGRAYAFARD
ncbi:hypothetical protein [Streptomyces erythrochromogenes]|uniref:hypothetical protein n=1 Tax=Streptomyces erythrochromogenes TaxID=285574 RepID=UPI0033FB0AFF